ncbi:hypothetical protein ABEB36_012448 [Hypothenemus hampei]|uniref:Uncharacterized protein n=1 Tax=Hypothenemus hampei TaxID=57062 RepID=A0ABD1EBJ0_HYPHA
MPPLFYSFLITWAPEYVNSKKKIMTPHLAISDLYRFSVGNVFDRDVTNQGDIMSRIKMLRLNQGPLSEPVCRFSPLNNGSELDKEHGHGHDVNFTFQSHQNCLKLEIMVV